jgi:diguanylate cyclase (GGDEF)-like protein
MNSIAPKDEKDESTPPERMEQVTETWLAHGNEPITAGNRQAYLVHIYPTGPGMGTRYPLADAALVIGRGNECDIQIADPSVSRRHARIQTGPGGHRVEDLESTNGTLVNDVTAKAKELKDGDYLRIGNCIYRFLAGDNIETEYHEEIYRLTIIDGLTDSYNKRYLTEFLERELARSARYRRPLTIVLFDIDRFKLINDEYGHLAGDSTLRELAACVRAVVRKEELFARYGGEEFIIVLPETTVEGALKLSERIRSLVENHVFRFEDKQFGITISLGIATTTGAEGLTPTDLIRQVDDKLYKAKREGRNRIVV